MNSLRLLRFTARHIFKEYTRNYTSIHVSRYIRMLVALRPTDRYC
jgi:hypothetical protein